MVNDQPKEISKAFGLRLPFLLHFQFAVLSMVQIVLVCEYTAFLAINHNASCIMDDLIIIQYSKGNSD